MAKAIGNKSHGEGGEFESAGRNPAAALHSGLSDFMDQRGIDFEASKPKTIQDLSAELEDYHVIVSLKGKARSYLDSVPFHTTLLDWDVGEVPAEGGDACDLELDNAYRQLAVQIHDLMCLLRGDEPSRG